MSKRVWDDFDPNKSDPEDEDYDASVSRAKKISRRDKAKSKPRRKRQRTDYGDESEDISDSALDEESFDDSSIHNTESDEEEVNEATGRPIRKSTKKQVTYEESEDENSTNLTDSEDETSEATTALKNPRKAGKGLSNTHRQSLVVKLSMPTEYKSSRQPKSPRKRRISAASASGIDGIAGLGAMRRSSRLAQDDSDALVALTNSGNHENVVRPGTRSPEARDSRPTRATKGVKLPPTAVSEHDDDDSDVPTMARTSKDAVERPASSYSSNSERASQIDPEFDSKIEVTASQVNDEDQASQPDLVVPESNVEDDDDEDAVVRRPPRPSRQSAEDQAEDGNIDDKPREIDAPTKGRRSLRARSKSRRKGMEDTSDFEPEAGKPSDEDLSVSSEGEASPIKGEKGSGESASDTRRSQRRRPAARPASSASEGRDSDLADEIAVELQELQESRPRRRRRKDSLDDRPRTRTRKPVDYRILRPETNLLLEDEGPASLSTPSKRKGGTAGGWQRSLFSTYGPFGGAGGPPPVFGGPPGATGGVGSDSSDDELQGKIGGVLPGISAATPTAAAPAGFGMFPPAQTHSADPLQATLGKVKDKKALADADPLGVDQNVTFDGVGGMEGHIDQLKEMVMLPLLYPEIFQRFKITPPRGVLFHGPPGTGKTLLARALASTVSIQGQKVTFYMRKGADALSKWVGEAERQLRLLFEEARKNQPSIIFFDEIDGLAPVRSSKQEQIHASIVSTLLALMDGMDGRGQVIVIGATNRPDSVDPALRRPGRFDREFYFPLPDQKARRAIIDIHTRGWDPPVSTDLKQQLAAATKGYGGADLRALCTEAALNAVQRTYPQIYRSYEKRQIKPDNINVISRDFMLSLERIVPSSERSTAAASAPLPKSVAPLLEKTLTKLLVLLDGIMPRKKPRTALEEALYEDSTTDLGLKTELLQQEFSRARVFRPRLLIHGPNGMGQHYLAGAILNAFEGFHVQSFDLPSLLGDATRSVEAAIVQLFVEVKRHKPSVIYLPSVDDWLRTIGDSALTTFQGLLNSLNPSDPILVLGIAHCDVGQDLGDDRLDAIAQIFNFSSKNRYMVTRPDHEGRQRFFDPISDYLKARPSDFPDPGTRKKRILEDLPLAPKPVAAEAQVQTREEAKNQRKKDRRVLNNLKVRIQPIMDQIKLKYKKFRVPVIEDSQLRYLFEEDDPLTLVTTNIPPQAYQQVQIRPFERSQDSKGEPGLIETATGKFFYNMETVTIEKRLSNGFYKRPQDFLADIKKLTKDANMAEDPERLLKAKELQTNVEVDLDQFEVDFPTLIAECEALYQRELKSGRGHAGKSHGTGNKAMAPPSVPHRQGQDPEDIQMLDAEADPEDRATRREEAPKFDTSQHEAANSFLSNGTSDLDHLPGHPISNSTSNTTSNGFKPSSETQSTDTPQQGNNSFGQSAQTRSIYHSTGAPTTVQQRLQTGQLSQRSAITPIAEGASPSMYHNSASTTSSDKHNTDSSLDRTSQSFQGHSEPHEKSNRLDMSTLVGQPFSNSQLPDTQSTPQGSSSSPTNEKVRGGLSKIEAEDYSQSDASRPSQPILQHDIMGDDLVKEREDGDRRHADSVDKHEVDEVQVQSLIQTLVEETSGCSVEQLEQVNSTLMDNLWQLRGQWDRTIVTAKLRDVLFQTLADMRRLQPFGSMSTGNGF